MAKESQPMSSQQFVDKMAQHQVARADALQESLPGSLFDLAESARVRTREALKLNPDDLVVIFGEQAYGLNEPPKVLGKRMLAKSVEKHGVHSLELFASYDIAGSEGGIYRMQLPHPNSPGGNIAINMLPGWKKGKNVATAGFRSPTVDELRSGISTIGGLYGGTKAENFKTFLGNHYHDGNNYANANIELLRELEKQIGLDIQTAATEDRLDSMIAANGGMQVMLYLWPSLVEEAQKNPTEGVRMPKEEEAPFYLYHEDGCMGRMHVEFDSKHQEYQLDTEVTCTCMNCRAQEITTPGSVLESERSLTWRAIPRVIAYSTLGIADGHITGGGSIYNNTAEGTANAVGVSYFPTANMSKSNGNGERASIFNYSSSALSKAKGAHVSEAQTFVHEGRAAMADLVLSIGVDQLKQSIDTTLGNNFTTNSRVDCPDPLLKNEEVIKT